jgi:hypothetical protein
VLPPVTFNEVGQRPLFGSEGLHTVWIYTIDYFRPCQRNPHANDCSDVKTNSHGSGA